jgi:hypothetical protein
MSHKLDGASLDVFRRNSWPGSRPGIPARGAVHVCTGTCRRRGLLYPRLGSRPGYRVPLPGYRVPRPRDPGLWSSTFKRSIRGACVSSHVTDYHTEYNERTCNDSQRYIGARVIDCTTEQVTATSTGGFCHTLLQLGPNHSTCECKE